MAMLFLLSVPCMGALHSLPSRPLLIHNETMARVTWQKLEGGGDKALNTAVEAARGHAVGQCVPSSLLHALNMRPRMVLCELQPIQTQCI